MLVSGICSRILISFLLLLVFTQAFAQGNLQLMPMRVVFEGGKKVEELNIINVGNDTARYSISLIQYRMKEDGGFERITEPDSGQYFADQNIRIFPRTVTLGPREAQAVKVQLIKANQLAPGEYRSHLYFRAIPAETLLGEEDSTQRPSGQNPHVSVQLVPVFGITIPVIIRKGELDSKVNLSNLSVVGTNNSGYQLNLRFNRTGTMSVYGDLVVNHVSSQGKVTEVGLVKGVAVYTPNARRNFQVKLMQVPGVDYNTGKLEVVYKTEKENKPILLARQELLLNK